MFLIKNRLSELILLLLVCLAPWAYGSVVAWAELGLYAGIAALTALNDRSSSGSNLRGLAIRLPGLALAGLALLSLLQAMSLPSGLLPRIAPSLAVSRASLLPEQPEHLLGDKAAVALPPATLSLEPDSTLQMAARLAAAWLLFQAVLRLKGTPGVSLRIARAVVCNAVLLSIFAIVQGLTWNGCIYWVRSAPADASAWSAGGPFVNHNHLAAYLNMGLGLALGLLLQGNGRDVVRRDATRLCTAYAAAIIAVGVISSQSRSGFLGLLAASLLFAGYLRGRLITVGVRLAVALVMIGLCLAVLAGSSPFGSRLATILDVANEGYWSRLEIWRRAMEAWWARPIWGSGLGTFPVAIAPHLKHHSIAFFARAENEYVDLLVEGGTIGVLLLLAFLAGMGVLIRRAVRNLTGDQKRGIVGGSVFGLIALSVQSCADFAPHIPAVGVLAVILCGMIARYARLVGREREEHAVKSPRLASPNRSHRRRYRRDHNSQRSSIREIPASAIESRSALGRPWSMQGLAAELTWLGSGTLSVCLVINTSTNVWIENRLERAGLPPPGAYQTTAGTLDTETWGLDDYRLALQSVFARRPNWSEGYVRLGLVHLGLYRQAIQTWLEDSGADLDDVALKSDPLWLLGTMHGAPGKIECLARERGCTLRRAGGQPSSTGGALFSRPDAVRPFWLSPMPSWPRSITCWSKAMRAQLI